MLIDGRNVQRALERSSAPASLPTAALIARLRAAFSPPTRVELILDGHSGGSPTGKIAPGFEVLFTRHATADGVIAGRVEEVLRELGPVDAWTVVVVTDDREVRDHARRHGVRVQGTDWLAGRVDAAARGARSPGRPAETRRGTTIGHGRPPRRG